MPERCEITELPVGQCGGACCRSDLEAPEPPPIRWEGSDRKAQWPGRCAHCGQRFPVGAHIVCADLQGDGSSDEWCLFEHTRSPFGGNW